MGLLFCCDWVLAFSVFWSLGGCGFMIVYVFVSLCFSFWVFALFWVDGGGAFCLVRYVGSG